jgi:thiopurine S-methyltransferase
MDKSFWIKRWEQGETGWHQQEIEPALISNFSSLKPTRVLVPLCGKSLDLTWLIARGHEVIGVELSELACESFFQENNISHEVTRSGSFKIFRGPNITLFNGDFFELSPSEIGQIGAIYDRAALIALPPQLRPTYTNKICSIVESCARDPFSFLQIVLVRIPKSDQGPPFSVSFEELQRLYGAQFKIELVNRESFPLKLSDPSVQIEESTYWLRKIG